MKNVLIVTSAASEAPHAVSYAIARAREIGGGLVALAVLDPELTRRVAATLTNVGFVGEKVSDNVIETILREQRMQAEALLREVGEQAKREGISYTPLIEEGDPTEICSRLIRAHDVHTAVLVAEKRSWLTRFLSRSAAVKLPALAGCEVKVMEE